MSDLPVLQSPLLTALPGVRHAFFTRQGGVSRGVYESLNLGRGSKDDPAAVEENRRRAAAHLGVTSETLLTCYQIHSANALTVVKPWGETRPEADGVVTAEKGLACGALSADCAPILLADPHARVAAAAHAGWRGALDGIVGATVKAMTELGAVPSRMVAAVGPCIGPQSYEVGPDFLQAFSGAGAEAFFRPAEARDKSYFDLPGFVLMRLKQAGVDQAEWVGRDTCAEEELFFSNRRNFKRGDPDYGRLLSAIVLV